MSVRIQMLRTNPAAYECALPLRVEATKLVVGAGAFVAGGRAYTLAHDVEHTWDRCAVPRTVRITLVRERQSGDVTVVVDECLHDGVDQPYQFQGSPYEPLHVLAVGDVPSECADATQGTWTVWHVVAPPAASEPLERVSARALSDADLQKIASRGGVK